MQGKVRSKPDAAQLSRCRDAAGDATPREDAPIPPAQQLPDAKSVQRFFTSRFGSHRYKSLCDQQWI